MFFTRRVILLLDVAKKTAWAMQACGMTVLLTMGSLRYMLRRMMLSLLNAYYYNRENAP